MKKLSLLKKCVVVFIMLYSIIATMTLNAQTFVYNNLKYKINGSNVTVIGHVNGQYVYGAVNIPSSVKYNGSNYTVTAIGKRAFMECSNLTSITISDSVTEIDDNAFDCCRGLTSVTLSNSLTIIGDYAFYACQSLTSITLPNSLTKIDDNAFGYCLSLTSINIPNSVTEIGHDAFRDCSSLTRVVSLSQIPPELDYGAFYNIGTNTVYVPVNCASLYIDSSWSDYFSIIIEYHVSVSEVDEISASVYPNPTSGIVRMETENLKNISIYNISGQLIYEKPSTGDIFEYDFGKHGAGVYIIRIETEKGAVTQKVTVK